MTLKMQGSDKKMRWHFATSLLFLFSPSFSQMVLKFDLSGIDINSGKIEIGEYKVDSTRVFYSKEFSGHSIQCNLELNDTIATKNAVLIWKITGSTNQNFASFFMASLKDSILFFPVNSMVVYGSNHSLFKFVELSNNFDGSENSKKLIVIELFRLLNSNKYNDYIEFLFYNALKNGLIHQEELSENKLNFNPNSTWGKLTLEILSKDSDASIIDAFCADNSLALIKFWATWCKPCLVDNKTLSDLYFSGNLGCNVLGIQEDSNVKEDNYFYKNVMDENGHFKKKYNIVMFPTYLLYENNELVLRTSSLDEILSLLKK
jgi:thiol-disulfide isomerase/thioredoxin